MTPRVFKKWGKYFWRTEEETEDDLHGPFPDYASAVKMAETVQKLKEELNK